MLKIFRAQAVVTCNLGHEIFSDAFLAIEGNKIRDLGAWNKRPKTRKAQNIDVRYGMITPGLFNLHSHLPMTLFRGVAEDLDLKTWLNDYIIPLEAKWVTRDFVRAGAELAALECIRNGVTFIADMYYFEDEVAEVIDRLGLRGLIAQHLWDAKGPDSSGVDEYLEISRRYIRKWKNHPRILAGLAPHAPYTCSPTTLRQCASLARELDAPAMIHLAETKWELNEIKQRYGKTPAAYVGDSGLLNSKNILLAHSIWLEGNDFSLVKRPNVTMVLNTQCNAKLASGVPPIQKFYDECIRFAVGTDGAASNNNLDIFAEINFLSKIHHMSEGKLDSLPGSHVFDSVTRLAAEAVGLGDQLGSLEPGKDADFIILDLRAPHLSPLTKPYSHLIYSVRGSDVESVYVKGRCLMKNRKIKVADELKVLKSAEKIWAKMAKFIK